MVREIRGGVDLEFLRRQIETARRQEQQRIYTTLNGQAAIYQPNGDAYYFVDSTDNVTMTLASANRTTGIRYTFVNKTTSAGAGIILQALSGSIQDTASFTVSTAYETKTIMSDGTDYWPV